MSDTRLMRFGADGTWHPATPRVVVEVAAAGRFWPCRLLRHQHCPCARRTSQAVVRSDLPTQLTAAWLRCPCRCHGGIWTGVAS